MTAHRLAVVLAAGALLGTAASGCGGLDPLSDLDVPTSTSPLPRHSGSEPYATTRTGRRDRPRLFAPPSMRSGPSRSRR